MKYSNVYIDAIGYEIAPVVVSSLELERRLEALYSALHLGEGQLEALTGINERRWWEEGHRISDGAIAAARTSARGFERRGRRARGLDLRRRVPRVLRAGDGLSGGVAARRQPGSGGLRREQRLPGSVEWPGRYRQPDRGRPDPRGDGGRLRDRPRDQRDRDRPVAGRPQHGFLQALAGHAHRAARAPWRWCFPTARSRRRRAIACWAASREMRRRFTAFAAGASRRPARPAVINSSSSHRPMRRPC